MQCSPIVFFAFKNVAPPLKIAFEKLNRSNPLTKIGPTESTRVTKRLSPIFALACFVFVLGFPTERTHAQTTFNWVAGAAYWNDQTAWSPIGVPTAADTASFAGSGGSIFWNQSVGFQSIAEMEFTSGNYSFQNLSAIPFSLTIGGSGSAMNLTNGSSASVKNIHFDVNNGSMTVANGSQFELQSGANSKLTVSDDLFNSGTVTFGSQSVVNIGQSNFVGYNAHGVQNIQGATVTNDAGYVAYGAAATGSVSVSGAGSIWQNRSSLEIGSHSTSNGQVDVENGAKLSVGDFVPSSGSSHVMVAGNGTPELSIQGGTLNNDGNATVGLTSSYSGSASIVGPNSNWHNDGYLTVGTSGAGNVMIANGGHLSASQVFLGQLSSGNGSVAVMDSGSHFEIASNLHVGQSGLGELTISDNGLVTVAGSTNIGDNGSVSLNGGRFEFGTMSLSHFNAVTGTSGSMKGTVNHSSYTNAASLQSFMGSQFDFSDVTLANDGTLFGNASLEGSVVNKSGGELETLTGERLRFSGNGTNAGEFNNFGGQLRFEGEVYNAVNAVINGRGQFIANGGWTNEGVMAFSGGTTDVVGDVDNTGNGQIVTSGNSTTTFYDDVVHNGLEIRTGEGSNTVFFGSVSGAGNYTGTGTVFFEGDLRPGNSPDVVSFEGNVTIGSTASTLLEIAGQQLGDFDRLEIAGDLDLSGELQVWLSGGFELTPNQQFEVFDIAGMRQGMFANFDEGDLVGTFGGQELFITYSAGDGNDIALFTAIPEPSALAAVLGMSLAIFVRRRKHKS